MLKTWLILAGAWLVLAGVRANALDVTLVEADGEERKGALSELNNAGATVSGKKSPAKEITQLVFPNVRGTSAPSAPAIILRNGDRLAQVGLVAGTDTRLKLKPNALDETELEYKTIDAIIFYGSSKRMPDGLEELLKGAPPKEDVLLTVKGESITGFYAKLDDKTVSFTAGEQTKAYPFDQVALLRLAATEKFEANKALNAVLNLVDGSRLTVKPTEFAGDTSVLRAEALDGKVWNFGAALIASLEYSGGRMVYLSALTPKSVEQKAYVGGAPVVFTWRKDRSVANTPLKIGNATYEKGIGVHSYCKLIYGLNGEYVSFMSDIGMDASAPARSVCAWRVVVDGKEGAVGVGKVGGDKMVLKLDVTGANSLELICDFGADEDDSGDRLDFAKARLIKP